jgi:hypothetical protein
VLNGTDNHIATQIYVEKVSDGSTLLFDEIGGSTSYTAGSNLFDDVRGTNVSYRWQIRYKGENLGWTPWSNPTTFVTSEFARFDTLISNNTANFDLEEELRDNWGWDTVQRVQGTITIPNGVTVFSTNRSIPAFKVPNLPSGSQVSLTNSGRILGKGGEGGYVLFPNETRPGHEPVDNSEDPSERAGGLAFEVLSPINVTNFGNISGGGGGGGSAIISDRDSSELVSAGGGAGVGGGLGGPAPQGAPGQDSTLTSPGSGGFESRTFTIDPSGSGADGVGGDAAADPPGTGDTYTASGSAQGGDGGSYGQPGQFGSVSYSGVKEPDTPPSNTLNDDLGQPGEPGFAIVGEANINWQSGQTNVQGPIAQ